MSSSVTRVGIEINLERYEMWIVTQESRDFKDCALVNPTTLKVEDCPRLVLVDREKTKEQWWTFNPELAIVFESREAAERTCSRYSFNNPKVMPKSYLKTVGEFYEMLCGNVHNSELQGDLQ
jgi:hypothetical protein